MNISTKVITSHSLQWLGTSDKKKQYWLVRILQFDILYHSQRKTEGSYSEILSFDASSLDSVLSVFP